MRDEALSPGAMTEIRATVATALSYGAKAIGVGLAALVWMLLWGSMAYKGAVDGQLTQAMFGGLLAAAPLFVAAYRLYEWSEFEVDAATLP